MRNYRTAAGVLMTWCVLLAIGIAAAPSASAAGSWVVDGSPGCSNTGPGTDAQPLCTISAAAAKATQPGDRVTVRPGRYAEQVTIAGSGTADNPIAFLTSGPGVTIVGTQDLSDPATWTQVSATAWGRPYAPPSAPRQVFRDAVRLTSVASAAAMTQGSFFYDSAAKTLTVDVGGANPAAGGHTVLAGAQTYGFNIVGRTGVSLTGFDTDGQNNAGVRVSGSSAVTVTGISSERSGVNGVLVEAGSTGVTVNGSTVADSASVGLRVNTSSGTTLTGNTVRRAGLHGISVTGSSGCRIVGNDSSYNTVTSGTATAAGIDISSSSTDAVVQGNVTHDNQDSGIQIYSGSHRATVVRNLSYANGDHGFDTLGSTNVRYASNTAANNRNDGISVEGASTGASLRDNIAVDNGLPTGTSDLFVSTDSTSGFTADSDLIYNSVAANAIKIGSTGYRTLRDYAAATGQEAHGLAQDPRFTNQSAGDLSLQPNSPALDSADASAPGFVAVDRTGTGPQDDLVVPDTGLGTPPYADRGALERIPQPTDPAQPPPNAALVLSTTSGQVPPAVVVTADATGSSDPSGGGITSYTFDFGDGTVVGPQASGAATHSYTAVGTPTVTVTVQDSAGRTAATSRTVTLTARPPVSLTVDNQDPTCSDTANGTSTPLCTISAAAARAQGGDMVTVHPGTYREQITPSGNGMAGTPLTFRASGPGVRVLGTTDLSLASAWHQTSTTAWSCAVASSSPITQVFRDGTPLVAASSLATMGPGTFVDDRSSGLLYVDMGGPNPATGHQIEASTRTYGFQLWHKSDVVIDGFELWGQNSVGVSVQDSSRMTLSNLTATSASSYGISTDRSDHVTVTGSSVASNGSIGIRMNASTSSTIQANTAQSNGLHGISVQGGSTVVVSGNIAHDNERPGTRVGAGIDISAGSTGAVVEDNTSYHNQDSGIEIYNGSNDAVVRRNLVYGNGDHGIDCLASTGVHETNNTAVGNATAGLNLEGGSSGGFVVDNISADNAVGSTRTVSDIRVDTASTPGTVVNRNLVWMTNGGPLYEWSSTRYTAIGAFRSATGQEADGLQHDPLFVDQAGADFRLTGDSPAVDSADSGAATTSLTDLTGRSPVDMPSVPNSGTGPTTFLDRGALEYAGPSAAVAVTPAMGAAPLNVQVDASGSTALGSPLTGYAFDCGNGTVVSTQSSPSTTCVYPAKGSFTVTATATDSSGDRDSATASVTVGAPQAPPAVSLAVSPSSDYVPAAFNVTLSTSTDPQGTVWTGRIDCGDAAGAAVGRTRTCTYPTAGTYVITGTVTNASGTSASSTKQVKALADVPPTARLGAIPSSVSRNTAVQVVASSSTDVDKTPIASYTFDCGNGVVYGPGTASSATCRYAASGQYTISVRVADTLGTAGVRTARIKVT